MDIRLNKYLSEAGICSRREADRMIAQGKVKVDGKVAAVGQRVSEGQRIEIGGRIIQLQEPFIFIALNKPRGIVCTTAGEEKNNVIRFLNLDKRVFPVGRLDKDSEGLLLLTNQGDWVNKMMRSGNCHEKEYIVKVNKPLTKAFIKGMRGGVPILGTVTRPCKVRYIDKYTFEIILTQGLNRQIRRMCEYFGYKVVNLKRIRVMNIKLGSLKTGCWRYLTPEEVKELAAMIKDSSNTTVTEEGKNG